MRRLGWIVVLPALLTLSGCPDDSSAVDGGETEGSSSSSSGGADDNSSTPPTTQSTTNMSMDGSSGDPPGTSTMGTTTGDPSTDSTTTGVDACTACIADNCGDEVAACAKDEDCGCWADCIEAGTEPAECEMNCNGQNDAFNELGMCVRTECMAECDPGGGTDTGTTGGMMGDGLYGGPCTDDMDCGMGQVCNGFLNTCTIDCTDDADCADPATGDASPACSGFSNTCILVCNGATCPDGMDCVGTPGPDDLCAWP